MRKIRVLDSLMPRTRRGILAATHGQPNIQWYASEIARRLDVPPSSLQRELENLTAAQILTSERQGRMIYYQANTHSPIYPELRGLLLKTAGLVDVLIDSLGALASSIKVAFIYGSIASETEQSSESDIDLMVVGAVEPMELSVPLRKAREQLGRDVNPTIYTVKEFAARRARKDHFLSTVLDKPKLFVVGNSDELDQIGS
jgi:DNA-binding transcriptional ArsR family regulator